MSPLVLLLGSVAGLAALNRYAPYTAAGLALSLERRRCGLEQKRLHIPDFEIAYLEGGQGQPLLLLHGIGADKDTFTRTAYYLTRRFRVIAVDLPGFGDSTRREDRSYAIGEQADRVHEIVERLGLGRVIVGGNSMGGYIAGAYAARRPNDVAALWLLAPAGVASARPTEVTETFTASGRSLLFAEAPEEFPRVMDRVLEQSPGWMPSCIPRVLGERSARDYALHTRIMREVFDSPSLESQLSGLDVPALIVWGKRDRVLDPSGGDALRELMPRSELIVMDGIGHLPMLEAPRRAAQDFIAFWQRATRA